MNAPLTLCWIVLFVVVGILSMLADPAAASLKRVIILERADVGFPTLMETWEDQKLRLAQTTEPSRNGMPVSGSTAVKD